MMTTIPPTTWFPVGISPKTRNPNTAVGIGAKILNIANNVELINSNDQVYKLWHSRLHNTAMPNAMSRLVFPYPKKEYPLQATSRFSTTADAPYAKKVNKVLEIFSRRIFVPTNEYAASIPAHTMPQKLPSGALTAGLSLPVTDTSTLPIRANAMPILHIREYFSFPEKYMTSETNRISVPARTFDAVIVVYLTDIK